ncbi:type II secretion system protein [Defluviitalea saccharophila]|uniref:Type II secretion system protein n=1 Tax=Defluviitalea saccharophila TaxID=879970 RepID=A0ABZ2Y3E5_9FIRM
MIKNENGVTLIELIVSLAIFSVIISLTLSVLLFGSRTFKMQTNETNNLLNVSNAMHYITKEIRKADQVEIENGILILNEKDVYKLENNIIMKNTTLMFYNIELFEIAKSSSKIDIKIKGIGEEKVESTIYLR